MSETPAPPHGNALPARQARIKKLIYRASYTGMKETDLLLGQFASRYLPDLSDEELDMFEALLEAGDPKILAWVCLLYTSPSPRDYAASRMPSSA